MFDGEWLYERLYFNMAQHGRVAITLPWSVLGPPEKDAFEETARDVRILVGVPDTATPDPSLHWKNLIRRYGRHDASCATSAPCTCGFADVEKLLT